MAKSKQNKAENLAEQIQNLLSAGKSADLATVDFSNPNRAKTCLEVDFPIVPINRVAVIEGNAGKPIYQMSKWWARRRSSVFRSMLIAAATKAPEDESLVAKTVWDAYYSNHQKKGSFKHLRVADIFMGGGTTVIEGARLGMQMSGNDLNPVAWFVVKGELAKTSPESIKTLLSDIETDVRPQIIPYLTAQCPRGHKGKWIRASDGQIMTDDFNPLLLNHAERAHYKYIGPEVIYTFWAKHGPCKAVGCEHKTPIMSSHTVATKEITLKAWVDFECQCGSRFDIEQQAARMAPDCELVISSEERAFAVMNDKGEFNCPHCNKSYEDLKARIDGRSVALGKSNKKQITLSLFVHPKWIKGIARCDENGNAYGGSVEDDVTATVRWNRDRHANLALIEVRGIVPETVILSSGLSFNPMSGTVPKDSNFTCQEATCGRKQDLLESVKAYGKTAPFSAYAEQCYCPECDGEGRLYGGRFFAVPRVENINAALQEWDSVKNSELAAYWPKGAIPVGAEIGPHDVNGHHYTHWWKMFNGRQLLILSRLLRSIMTNGQAEWDTREMVMAGFQQYLRNQNLFCFWNLGADKLEPHFSKNNFHPKATAIENSVFSKLGRGNWSSCVEGIIESVEWCKDPWELASNETLIGMKPELSKLVSGKSEKVYPGDSLQHTAALTCGSSTDLVSIADHSLDLVITDPPFGDLVQYAELSDFFYVWLRLALKDKYPEIFGGEYTPKTLEAVSNSFRAPEDPNAFYQRLMTQCWSEAYRTLKPGGLLAFTFHHSKDEPWVAVLESLFDAGFYLEATYPIRSDESKGDGDFGAQKIEYDIIHVCRKRLEEPTPISWAKLRRYIADDVRQLKGLLEQHQESGLPKADLEVIKRGKALEYYSRHYRHVYIEKGREFTLREALVGIHQLLDDETDSAGTAPPVMAEPFTRQFLRIFDKTLVVDRNQMQKYLRGTGTSGAMFEERGWCKEEKKIYHLCPPLDFAKSWHGRHRRGLSRDLDQSLFLLGACFPDSGISVSETLNNPNFEPHPAIGDILAWFSSHGASPEIRRAAQTAKQLYSTWLGSHKAKEEASNAQFDLLLEVG